MAHVEKYAADGVAGLERHCLRRTEGHKNKDIDPQKTHENYAFDNNEKPLEYMKQRMGEIRLNQRRDDIKVAASWVVTLPRDIPKEDARKFFETAHNFLAKRYGEKNILWSRVHMDETTPHLHFCFMPITPDKKHEGQEKLCAKDVLNRDDLKRFHSELSAEMARVFGRTVGIETGQTEKSLTLEKLKAKTEMDAVSEKLDTKKKELDAVLANRQTFVNGRTLATELSKKAKASLIGDKRVLEPELLQKAIDYAWNGGGKDDEIARLGGELAKATAAARAAEERAQKAEAQRGHLSSENTKLRSRTYDAEREKEKLQKVVAAVEKIDPGVLSRAVAAAHDRGRGGYSR